MKTASLVRMGGYVLATTFAIPALAEHGADTITGYWYSEDDASQIRVYRARTRDGKIRYYGEIVWLKDPVYDEGDPEAGKPRRDRENPRKDRQNDPIIGLIILKNFHFDAGSGAWEGGTIYDPEVGKTYKCVIKYREDPSKNRTEILDVRGYIGIPALGRTTAWTRVPGDEIKDETKDAD